MLYINLTTYIHFKGVPHRADADALNTLNLFFEMMRRQHQLYKLVKDAKATLI
jgi:inhibitor of KinA sporulation pathway (predicted exonuclease)